MAQGFGATLGAGTTDRNSPGFSTSSTVKTVAISTYRNGNGGGNNGRIWDGTAANFWGYASAGTYKFEQNTSATSGEWTIALPSASVWHHTLVTYDAGSVANNPIIYVDGASVTVTTLVTPTGTIDAQGAFMIGNRTDSTRNWDGMLAEFAIWDRILDAAEAKALGAGYSPLHFQNALVCYVPMVRNNVNLKGAVPTLVGTAVQPHPRMIYPHRRLVGLGSAAAAASRARRALLGVGS